MIPSNESTSTEVVHVIETRPLLILMGPSDSDDPNTVPVLAASELSELLVSRSTKKKERKYRHNLNHQLNTISKFTESSI
jgi:hypothetical protein